MQAVVTRDLCKTFTSVKKAPGVLGSIKGLFSREKVLLEAVKDVSLAIDQGELVGFLGPNGAGKTTTLKMLTGILHPTAGEASVLGFMPCQRRPEMLRQISLVMGNKMQLWWDLSAWDGFLVLSELYEVDRPTFKKRLDHLADCLQLTDKLYTQVRKLSLGERMKCELIAALLHRPRVVFLDEPTIGLDVVSQKRIRDFLKEWHKEEGCTILLTSHYMQDVQELCDRVVVIDHGSLIFDGTLDTLSRRFSDTRRLRLTFDRFVDDSDLVAYGTLVESDGETAVIDVPRSSVAVTTGAVLQNLPVSDVAVAEVDIEEVVRSLFTRSR
jgi:ABC-2 type transport system ATP-binding protein